MRSLNCVQRSDKALAAGAMGSFLLRSPHAWAAGGVGAARQRGWTWRGVSEHSKGRDEETKEQDIAADANTLQQTVRSSQGQWKKNVEMCSRTKKTKQIMTTLLNLLLKTATNLSHSVLCQRVPNL